MSCCAVFVCWCNVYNGLLLLLLLLEEPGESIDECIDGMERRLGVGDA